MNTTATDLANAYDAGQLREFLAGYYATPTGRRYDRTGRRRIEAISQAIAMQTGLTLDEIHYNATQDAEALAAEQA